MNAIQWQDRVLSLLDQSRYPQEEIWLSCTTVQETAELLSSGKILDAGVAAVAGAYGYCLAALAHQEELHTPAFDEALAEAKNLLLASRPGCRKMALAMDYMEHPPETYLKSADRLTALLATAVTYDRQEVISSRNICSNGCEIISEGTRVLVRTDVGVFHGAAPTGAFGIVRRAWKRELLEKLTLCEGRPAMAGAAIAKELTEKEHIPCTVIPDEAAATFLAQQGAHLVLTDGICAAANGDVMAPVGTYELAIACYFHSIPFYAVLPIQGADQSIPDGNAFPRADGDASLVTAAADCGSAEGWTPAYDVIPSFLVTGMITDCGIACAPYNETLKELMGKTAEKNIIRF